jgi:hypothetical protein
VRELVRVSELVGFELTEFEAPSNPGRRARAVQAVIRMIESAPDRGSEFTNVALETGPAGDGQTSFSSLFSCFCLSEHRAWPAPNLVRTYRFLRQSSLPLARGGKRVEDFRGGTRFNRMGLMRLSM